MNPVHNIISYLRTIVGIATGYGLDDHGGREFESQSGEKFSLLHIVQTGSGVPQPPIKWIPGALSRV
jgi:hypothetical protein